MSANFILTSNFIRFKLYFGDKNKAVNAKYRKVVNQYGTETG